MFSLMSAIKTEILEGVKIRSRIKEQIEGEKVSAYLVGRQNTIKSKKYITDIKVEENVAENLNEGTILRKQDSIEWYVNKYYEKVYKKESTDPRYQDWLLQFLDKNISDEEKEVLESEVVEDEIFNAIKYLNCKKSPGLDVIPNDIYLKFWNIIKNKLLCY